MACSQRPSFEPQKSWITSSPSVADHEQKLLKDELPATDGRPPKIMSEQQMSGQP